LAPAQILCKALPLANATRKIRVAVFGDCGNGSVNQTNVKNQALTYLGANNPDAWILLGDNAYSEGTDVQFQSLFFDMYKNDILKNWKLYPAPGNHDYGNTQSNSGVRNNDYYKNFTLPTAAEAGGVASGMEAYYSFNVGNTHFISLDSYGKENGNTTRLYDTSGAQVVWLKQDLTANTKRWTVVYFHHPPFTMGSHNSDAETELLLIRQNFIRILERFGVDLVLCGHSHNYERSYLLKEYYTNRASFNVATHTADASSAKYDGSTNSCPYKYISGKLNHGTVYVVAGSAGQSGGIQPSGLYPHPALPFEYTNDNIGGSLMLEFEDNRLDAKMVGADGIIKDQFTIMKDVAKKTIVNIVSGNGVLLNASWIGTYNWTPTSATSRSITVNPTNNTMYYVSDNAGCIKDTFDVRLITLPFRQFVLTAQQQNQQLNLQWQTVNEQQVAHFEVQESLDGQAFATIAKLTSKGNSVSGFIYQHKKLVLQTGKYFYRIKALSKDGSEQFSNMLVQDLTTPNFVSIVPNIVKQGQPVKILLHNIAQINRLDAVGVDGKLLKQFPLRELTEWNTSEFGAGVYYLRVIRKDGRSFIEKLVVN
jgi:3',5'-cyclic AMP phosphodiesterase CpdA